MSIFNVERDAVPVGLLGNVSTTLTVVSGDTLYYADNSQVSSTNNQGSLTSGNSATFTNNVWIVSASASSVSQSFTAAASGGSSGGSGASSPFTTQQVLFGGLRLAGYLDDGAVRDQVPAAPAALNAAAPLTTPTYDASGQATEPDIVFVPEGWNGWRYWLHMMPFPAGDATKENPSLLVSQDGQTWQVPVGLTNPLFTPSSGSAADGAIFLDKDGTMYCYFLTSVPQQVNWMKSTDGIHWTAPVALNDFTGSNDFGVANGNTPTVTWDGKQYWFHINRESDHLVRYATSSSPTGFTAASLQACAFTGTVFTPDHHNVKYWNGRFYMVNSDRTRIYLSTSLDGINWVTAGQILNVGGAGTFDHGGIYRTAFLITDTHEGKALDLWYSAFDSSVPALSRIAYTRMYLSTGRFNAVSIQSPTSSTTALNVVAANGKTLSIGHDGTQAQVQSFGGTKLFLNPAGNVVGVGVTVGTGITAGLTVFGAAGNAPGIAVRRNAAGTSDVAQFGDQTTANRWALDQNCIPKWTDAANQATGSGSAALGANCPAVTATAPYQWLKAISSDGSTCYIPAWK